MDAPPPAPATGPPLPGRTAQPKTRTLWIILLILVPLLIGAGSIYAYRHYKRDQPILVQTEKVTRRDLTELVVATGRIQPVLEVKISPEVSGEIIELAVKEGQRVQKGDLLLRIKPDFYIAFRKSAEASYLSAQAGQALAKANQEKCAAELTRYESLVSNKLVSDSDFLEIKTACDVARAQYESATHQATMAKAALARADEELAKTTIVSPLAGTISKLNSRLGERVVGTATMAGTDVMTIADLEEMEARVDIGEVDVVLIQAGQKASLEVDAFRDRKFTGTVYQIANTAKTFGSGQQDATKFEVKIRIEEKERFLPGMSVTADIQTRYRTNVLTVPIQSVTTRLSKGSTPGPKTPSTPGSASPDEQAPKKREAKTDPAKKPPEVVFVVTNRTAMLTKVTRGISDDDHVEITTGLSEGQEVVSGSYKAINRELEDGKKVKIGTAPKPDSKPAPAPGPQT